MNDVPWSDVQGIKVSGAGIFSGSARENDGETVSWMEGAEDSCVNDEYCDRRGDAW
tara:strand:- start:170 stop:337 length:168 start_codon:yes stop_codon:yes gene_type:complete